MAGIVNERYTWNLDVFEAGAPEDGVTITVFDYTFPTPAVVVDEDTVGGSISEKEIVKAIHSITGTSTRDTEAKTPHRIQAQKYGLTKFQVDKSFTIASQDSYFLSANPNISEPLKSVVDTYTGISVNPSQVYSVYAFANNNSLLNLGGSQTNQGIGQSVEVGGPYDGVPDKVTVEMKKVLAPTGNVVAKFYAESGGIPTGTALATSDPIDVERLTTGTEEEVTFFFPNAAGVKLTSTLVFFTIEYSGGDATNYIQVAYHSVGTYANGNKATLATATWTAQAGEDVGHNITGGLIRITVSHTMAEIYDYVQSYLVDVPQYNYLEALETPDSVGFTCKWNFMADGAGVAVTGPLGMTLSMPNVDFQLLNGATFAGVVTDIDGTATFISYTNLITNSEVRIYRTSDDVELAGIENSGTSFTYNYTHTVDVPIYVVIAHLDYKILRRTSDILLAASQSIAISQEIDRVYSNP